MRTKKILSLVLAAALVIGAVPTTAFAEIDGAQDSGLSIGASGICEHHTEHTADCGYTEGTAETPCAHEHTSECYPDSASGNEATPTEAAEPTNCTHTEHTADCGYAPAVEGTAEIPCTHEHDDSCGYVPASEGVEETPCAHEHDEGCGYVPAVEGAPETPCAHEHGAECYPEADSVSGSAATPTEAAEPTNCPHTEHTDDCGYAPAVEGTPCGYVCEICNPTVKTITAWAWNDEYELIVDGSIGLIWDSVAWDDLAPMLPSITATIGEAEEILTLDWSCVDVADGMLTAGTHILTAALPEGYALGEDIPALTLTLEMGGGDVFAGETGDFLVEGDELNGASGTESNMGNITDKDFYYNTEYDTLYILTNKAMTLSTPLCTAANPGSTIIAVKGGISGGASITLNGVHISTTNVYAINATSALNLTLKGENTLTAAGYSASSYGGLYYYGVIYSASNISITGSGELNAAADDDNGLGIYSGMSGNGGVTIESGTVIAEGGIGGTFSTGENGNAFIVTNSFSNMGTPGSGVIFVGDAGKVYGSPTIKTDATIPAGATLTVDSGQTLTIAEGVELTNNGTIIVNGTLTINGTISGSGTLTINGTISGSGTIDLSDGGSISGTIPQNIKLQCSVTTNLTRLISNGAPTANNKENYTATLTADSGYELPDSITVKVGGTALTAGAGYTYSKDNGVLSIPTTSITGNIVIEATGVELPTYIITATPNTLTFDSQKVGYTTAPAAQTVTITNTGNQEVTVNLPTSTNYDITAGTGFTNGTATLVPNGTATFTVQPKTGLAKGTYNTAITISGSNSASADFTPTFTVTAPNLTVTAPTFSNLTFGYEEQTAQAITIANSGDAAAAIEKVEVSGTAFTIEGSGDTVAASGSIDTWKIKPNTGLAGGTHTGTITVTYDGGKTVTANVSITVKAPVLEVTAPTFAGVQAGYSQPAPQGITIKNTGDADANISNVEVDDKTAFTIGGSGNSVTAGSSITSWTVQPSDGLSKGTYTGTITVTYDNGAKATAQISFGVAAPNLVITAPTFAGVQEGYTQPAEQNITIQNTGDAAANITNVVVDNKTAFTIDGSGSTVAAGGSISSWTVQPSAGLAVGDHTATITVQYDNGAEATATVTLAVSEKTYSVTVSGSYAGTSGAGSYTENATVTINAGTRSGYTFAGWTSTDGVAFANASSATTTFTMPGKDVTVTASWNKNSGGGTSGGGSNPHTHTFESGWTSDSTGHWHKATCGHTGEKGSFAAHTPGAAATATTPQTCTVCDYVITPATGGGYDDGDDDYTPPTPKPQPETGESGGWNEIRSELRGAKPGDTIVVKMNGATVVPKEVSREIAGKDVTVIFDMGSSVSWTVNGKDIPQTIGDLNLGIKTDSNSIPVTVINALTGEVSTMQFELSHSGPFGTILHLTLDVGRENRGYWANLYYFDETLKELVFQYASRIDANGKASWPFDHASSYAVVIDEENHDPDGDKTNPNTGGNDNPDTGAGNPFTDVKETDWFYEDVLFVFYEGIMLGTSDTTFSPNGTLTRGMMAAILWRMEGSPAPSGKNPFTDVPADEYYTDAITWANEQGIYEGYGNNLFGPNDPITRQQLATIFYRYAEYKGYDLTPTDSLDRFTDKGEIADWAQEAMKWAVGSGLIFGTSDTTLAPTATATRAQIAVILHRFIDKYGLEEKETYTGLMGWVDPNSDYLNFPKAGDGTNAGHWAGLTLFAAAGTGATILVYRRKRKKDKDGATPTPA